MLLLALMQQAKSAFSQYYDDRTCNTTSVNKRPFIKSILCADTNKQMICHIKIRHSYAHDNIDFIPILSSIQNALPISLVVADKGYDDEKNRRFVRESLLGDSIILARFADIPIWKTRGKYRKHMKRGNNK